jgi:hypothetical protein
MAKYSVGFYYKAWVEVEADDEYQAVEIARNETIDPSDIEYYEMKPDVYVLTN